MTIPASKLAVIAMHELLSCVLAHGGLTNYGNASRRVGRAVQAEWGMDALKGARNRFQVNTCSHTCSNTCSKAFSNNSLTHALTHSRTHALSLSRSHDLSLTLSMYPSLSLSFSPSFCLSLPFPAPPPSTGARNRVQVNMAQVSKACKARDVRRLNDLLARVFRRPNWDDPVSGPRVCCCRCCYRC
jgi:hypothetical protein